MTNRRIFAIYAGTNTPGHGNDAGGAFIPESINFAKYRQTLGDVVERVQFDNVEPNKAKRRAKFLELVSKAKPFDAFAYFGHGLRNSLSSAAIGQPERKALVDLLVSKADRGRLVVTLYACSTGETTTGAAGGEGGFADRLRDDLAAAGMVGWVDAHTCAAHTTQNPYVRRFIMGERGNVGGDWLVEPKSAEWARWRQRLNSKWRDDPFRFVFPYLSAADVRDACSIHG